MLALRRAALGGFAAEAAVGMGFIPGVEEVEQLADPQHLCRHAVPLRHYHFFTPDGFFGSLNQDLEQVDDGTYTVVGDTLSIRDDRARTGRIPPAQGFADA